MIPGPTDNGYFNLLWQGLREQEGLPAREMPAEVQARLDAEIEALRGQLAAEAARVARDDAESR